MSSEFLSRLPVIPAGKRKIVKIGDRYLIYLPTNLNEVWEYLHRSGKKVSVFLVQGDSREEGSH